MKGFKAEDPFNQTAKPAACVFVGSLSNSSSDTELYSQVKQCFSRWGKILNVKVLRDVKDRPYSFVQYANIEDADRAIVEGQRCIIGGRSVRCEKAQVNRTLFVNTTKPITKSELISAVASFGEYEMLISVDDKFQRIETDTNSKWFVQYECRDDAISAYGFLKLWQKQWSIEWAQNTDQIASDVPQMVVDKRSIYIGNLDPTLTDSQIVGRFKQYGDVKQLSVVMNHAFIHYYSEKSAGAAIAGENNTIFGSKIIDVEFRHSYNKYQKRAGQNKNVDLKLAPPPVNVIHSQGTTCKSFTKAWAPRSSKIVTFNSKAVEKWFAAYHDNSSEEELQSVKELNVDTVRSTNTLYSEPVSGITALTDEDQSESTPEGSQPPFPDRVPSPETPSNKVFVTAPPDAPTHTRYYTESSGIRSVAATPVPISTTPLVPLVPLYLYYQCDSGDYDEFCSE